MTAQTLYGLIHVGKQIDVDGEAHERTYEELKEENSDGGLSLPFSGIITPEMFCDMWTGHIVGFKSNTDFKKGNEAKSSMKKFTRQLTKHKKLTTRESEISLVLNF